MVKYILAGLVGIALMGGLLSAPAQAQGRKPAADLSNDEKANAKAAQAVDAQYRAVLDRTRKLDEQPAQVDPWANMRGTETTPAKKK